MQISMFSHLFRKMFDAVIAEAERDQAMGAGGILLAVLGGQFALVGLADDAYTCAITGDPIACAAALVNVRGSGTKGGVDDVINTPKGQRPDPSEYMTQAEIDVHLALFDDGAVRFTTRDNLDTYGTAGGGDAFVMPKSEFDRIVSEAGGDMGVVEQRLGLDAGSLSNGNSVALYVPPQNLDGIRVPSGNEGGANSQWVPGGYTSGGTAEAVVDLRDAPIIEIEF